MNELLFPVLIFLGVTTFGVGLILIFFSQNNVLTARLQALSLSNLSEETGSIRKPIGSASRDEDGKGYFSTLLKKFGKLALQIFGGYGDDTEQRLAMAGFNPQSHLTAFHGIRVMLGLSLATAGGVFMLMQEASMGKMVLWVFFGTLLGLLLPNFWLGIKVKKRKEAIATSLPNMVDLLVVCVEAGLGLDAAMSRVGQELELSAPELSQELNQLGRELGAGQSHEIGLSRLAWRIGTNDMDNLVSMLVQAERFGTSIAVSLRVFSDSYRTARRQRTEETAAKTTVKLLFPLVFFIFPAIFVIILGPAALNILVTGVFK